MRWYLSLRQLSALLTKGRNVQIVVGHLEFTRYTLFLKPIHVRSPSFCSHCTWIFHFFTLMMQLGFLGLGIMGAPMALNLARHFPLIIWNRSSTKYSAFGQTGARVAATPIQLIEQSDIIFTMLFDESALETVIDDTALKALHGKVLVNTSSINAAFSRSLARRLQQAHAEFVEMPVSGSRIPAENGQLIGMLAGDPAVVDRIRPYVKPITKAAVYCGPIGQGLKTKYAVNTFLISLTVGLAESLALAQAQGLDRQALAQVLNAGPMSSTYTKLKLEKVIEGNWSAQASIEDCYNSTELILKAAEEAAIELPLTKLCSHLYGDACRHGLGKEDMIAAMKILNGREGAEEM